MGRSENIKSRVLRNLNNFIPSSNVTDEDIYDELTKGQDIIISEINPTKTIQITLQQSQEYYPLSTDTGTIKRKNIANIRAVKLPSGWCSFNIIPIYQFIQVINSNPNLDNHYIGTIYDDSLRIYPASASNGILECIVYLCSSTTVINKDNEPEISEYFDKALELYATSQFLTGDLRIQYMNEFIAEVRRLRPLVHRTYQLNRASLL